MSNIPDKIIPLYEKVRTTNKECMGAQKEENLNNELIKSYYEEDIKHYNIPKGRLGSFGPLNYDPHLPEGFEYKSGRTPLLETIFVTIENETLPGLETKKNEAEAEATNQKEVKERKEKELNAYKEQLKEEIDKLKQILSSSS